jgi:predicted 2-oxoglutarate/Fe(II)-dependent dioxygenase YbiX
MSLFAGVQAPWFVAPTPTNPTFSFSSLGGQFVLLAFFARHGPARERAFKLLGESLDIFQDDDRIFFGVLPDAHSFALAQDRRMVRWFDDTSGAIRRLFDAERPDGEPEPQWVLLDPALRVIEIWPEAEGERAMARLRALGPAGDYADAPLHAPVLIVPRIFEPELCRRLIDVYHEAGGAISGVMRERGGRTIGVVDDFKKRRDAVIADEPLKQILRQRLARRLLPEIEKVYAFKATRIERYIVACYDAAEGGYFRAHRDNTTSATAHRRFAVSINLNAEAFEGGDLRFPEFGPRTYRPPTGGAVVFSCSLLHEATPVTRGTRYAFLPFLFDEAGARVREANLHLLDTVPPA